MQAVSRQAGNVGFVLEYGSGPEPPGIPFMKTQNSRNKKFLKIPVSYAWFYSLYTYRKSSNKRPRRLFVQ